MTSATGLSMSHSGQSVILPWQQLAWQQLLNRFREGQLAHAYLVTGEQGIGKLHFLQQLARYLLCTNPQEYSPCDKCKNCKLSVTGYHPDIMLIQPEDGSRDIKIDQIRALTEFIGRTGHSGMAKLAIINQAHHLNTSAANSLLKTLEEPSADTYIFLATARADSLPATLRSRCQRLLMHTPKLAETTQWLSEQGIAVDQTATLAVAAGNRPLYALSLAAANGIADANEFLRSLLSLTQSRNSIQSAVAVALKIGEMLAVEYLVRTSSIVTREILTNAKQHDALMAELLQTFKQVPDKTALVRRLLQFNRAAEKALQQLQSGANPNPQLLLESILWQWSHLLIASPESLAAHGSR